MSERRGDIPLARLAVRNTQRNARRSILTAGAVTVAVAALVFGYSYVNGLIDNMLDTYARTELGHVLIRAEGYKERERMLPVHLNVTDVNRLVARLDQEPDIETVTPRIRMAALVDGGASNRPGMLLGLDLSREATILRPQTWVSEGRLPEPGKAEALIGTRFAEKLAVKPGDELTLLGQTAYRSLGGLSVTVTGLASSGMPAYDARLIIIPIDQAQYMADLEDGATELLVLTNDPANADSLAAHLRTLTRSVTPQRLEVLSWTDQGSIVSAMESSSSIFAFILLLLMLMAGLIIVNTMLMSVLERSREFGMLAALGMRRSDIVRLVVTEGLVIGIAGALAGAVLGSGIALWVEATGIDISGAAASVDLPFQAIVYPRWRLTYPLICGTAGFLAAGLASLYPALRAARMSPAAALRS